jgi:hypothetical protein
MVYDNYCLVRSRIIRDFLFNVTKGAPARDMIYNTTIGAAISTFMTINTAEFIFVVTVIHLVMTHFL